MAKVADISMSLDGYVVDEDDGVKEVSPGTTRRRTPRRNGTRRPVPSSPAGARATPREPGVGSTPPGCRPTSSRTARRPTTSSPAHRDA